MEYIITVLATAVALVGMVLLVSAKPRLSKLVTIWALVIAAGGGLLVYGYGYMDVTDNIPLAVLSALLAVCGSFVGADEYSVIPDSPALQTVPMQIICTLLRICALYVTASTVITAIGAGFLQRLRLWMSRRGQLNLIYGVCEDAPGFARELLEAKQGSVVFIVDEPSEDYAASIGGAGCVLRSDPHSLRADKQFLRSVGLGRKRRNVTLYALDADSAANIDYARTLLETLQAQNVDARDLHLVILAPEDGAIQFLQADGARYGYGFVTAVNVPQMAGRLLTLKYPPCQQLTFDPQGRATEDFEALIIGFGQVGQAVLRSLVMNGQAAGSTFRCAVFSPDCHVADGSFVARSGQLLAQYNISFHAADGRSRSLYEYIDSRRGLLKYVAICTGDHKQNREIGQALTAHFQASGLDTPVFLCSHSGVQALSQDGTVQTHNIFSADVLCTHQLDARAMILNHRYQQNSQNTPLENWMVCDYFSRQSCRASADFIPAMLRAAGTQAARWDLTDAQLENLSITEHLRWCAFHYCMGFSPMSDAEFAARAETYLQQKQAGQKPLRIGKNMAARTHACLVSWDELDILSEKEAKVTGNYVNYKAMDTDNVLAIPQLLDQQG